MQAGRDMNELRGFDDYALRLGDEMRGRRASMGKSLLDVERDLRIRAILVDAIEKADPKSFEAAWLIPGHVRSYARYLDMDPDDAYGRFCAECGFDAAEEQSARRKSNGGRSGFFSFFRSRRGRVNSGRGSSGQQFIWQENKLAFDALGSTFVLLALTGGIVYVGWAVFDEVQKVVYPDSEQVLLVTNSELTTVPSGPLGGGDALSSNDGLLQALVRASDTIGAIDPDVTGFFASRETEAEPIEEEEAALLAGAGDIETTVVQETVIEARIATNDVIIVPSRPSWIRVTEGGGTTLFEKVLASGEQYPVPSLDVPPRLRAGNPGSLYFLIDGEVFGPAGKGQKVVKNVDLSAGSIRQSYGKVVFEAVPREIHDSVRLSEAVGQAD